MFSYNWAQGGGRGVAVSQGGGSYLGSILHPVHSVLRAMVVCRAPVQVELAQAVGPAERAAPQHCEEKLVSRELGSLRPTRCCPDAWAGGTQATRASSSKRVLASIKANAVSVLSCLFAPIIIFNVNLTFMKIKAKPQGEPWSCRQVV